MKVMGDSILFYLILAGLAIEFYETPIAMLIPRIGRSGEDRDAPGSAIVPQQLDATNNDHDTDESTRVIEADRNLSDRDEAYSSESRDQSQSPDDDSGEVTDDQDWASIGAAALRQGATSKLSPDGLNAAVKAVARDNEPQPGNMPS